jgi:hypothetical protein
MTPLSRRDANLSAKHAESGGTLGVSVDAVSCLSEGGFAQVTSADVRVCAGHPLPTYELAPKVAIGRS